MTRTRIVPLPLSVSTAFAPPPVGIRWRRCRRCFRWQPDSRRRKPCQARRYTRDRAADPIAIPDFVPVRAGGRRSGREVNQVNHQNLRRSGLFQRSIRLLHRGIQTIDAHPRFQDWKVINAQALVHRPRRPRAGRPLQGRIPIVDTFAGTYLIGRSFFGQPRQHAADRAIIFDQSMSASPAKKGYFFFSTSTGLSFVDETGPKERRVNGFAIMDQDGANSALSHGGDDLVLRALQSGQAGSDLHV